MKTATPLIVLSMTKFGENSAVVHTLSPVYGRRGFLVRLGKKVPPAMLLPLSLLEAVVTENPKSKLWSAGEFIVRNPLTGIRSNMYKNSISLFISEVLLRTVRDGVFEDGLFEWCEQSVLTLDALQDDFSNFHVRFLLELAVALGFRPEWEDLEPFAGSLGPQMRAMLGSDMGASMLIPLTGRERSEMCMSILKYLEFHTETALNIRSLAVLKEIF